MKISVTRKLFLIPFIILLAAMLSGCSQLVLGPNFTLPANSTINGSLLATSSNVTLPPGTQVTGSVVMLCCNLIAEGEVRGNIILLTGNVTLGPDVNFRGKVNILTSNLEDQSGKYTRGERPSPAMLMQVIVLLGLVGFLTLLAVGILLYILLIWFRQKRKKPAPA